MGENHEKKGQTSQIRGVNEGSDDFIATTGDRRSRRSGESPQSIREVGIDSPDRSRGNSPRGLLGGILAQLILDTENQLGDARDSIAREQRRIEQLEEKLRNLQQLQEMQKVETTEN